MAAKAFDYGRCPRHVNSSKCQVLTPNVAHETLNKAHLAVENCCCQDGCTKCT